MSTADFDRAVQLHDELVKQHSLAVWIGSEPTFTDRFSEAPEWLREAAGSVKQARACQMLEALRNNLNGGIILRTLGRQYAEEPLPRWSLGLYGRRDNQPLWNGPLDPLLQADRPQTPSEEAVAAFWQKLTGRLQARGWPTACCKLAENPGWRLVFRRDDQPPPADWTQHPRLARPSVHSRAIPLEGLRDELAEAGNFMVAIGWTEHTDGDTDYWVPYVEMPAFPQVDWFLELLAEMGQAAAEAGLSSLILAGFPPPVDATVLWTTVTPDPAVVEVNMAPAPDATTFLRWSRLVFALADQAGLAPYRLHYNGQVTDSGGGGQITLGGPSPATSPFLIHPHLLPDLICYLNRHPALSYYFAFDCIGSTSQAPRADENTAELFQELNLALALLARQQELAPEMLWSSLAPFMADLAGNSHRSEINIEKLWNPYLPGRGRLGLVEFRAFRMAPTPEKMTALAVLLRAIVLLLISRKTSPRLVNWGRDLHDRFALPFYLRADLVQIVDELAQAGLGPGQPVVDELLDDHYYWLGSTEFQGCRLSVRRALEFWPLVGDMASQEHGGARLVDASTTRLEVSLRPLSGVAQDLEGWQLAADGYRLPLRLEEDKDGPLALLGLRYRRFKPWVGLHPTLGNRGPINLLLCSPLHKGALRVTLHEWKPQGGGYTGLPVDMIDAHRRCEERFVVEQLDQPPDELLLPPENALTPYCLDLRWL